MATPSLAASGTALLEDPCRGPEPILARRRRVQGTAEHPHERGIPVAGQLEEPAQVRTRVVTGEADRAVHRDNRQPGRAHCRRVAGS